MKKHSVGLLAMSAAVLLTAETLVWRSVAVEVKEDAIKEVMKNYHKAPKGVDPVCKKAADGVASKEEIKKLIEGYKIMTMAKPPKGDEASWKEKTTKLLAAAQNLEKGGPDAIAKYKEALDCKSCHTAHRPK